MKTHSPAPPLHMGTDYLVILKPEAKMSRVGRPSERKEFWNSSHPFEFDNGDRHRLFERNGRLEVEGPDSSLPLKPGVPVEVPGLGLLTLIAPKRTCPGYHQPLEATRPQIGAQSDLYVFHGVGQTILEFDPFAPHSDLFDVSSNGKRVFQMLHSSSGIQVQPISCTLTIEQQNATPIRLGSGETFVIPFRALQDFTIRLNDHWWKPRLLHAREIDETTATPDADSTRFLRTIKSVSISFILSLFVLWTVTPHVNDPKKESVQPRMTVVQLKKTGPVAKRLKPAPTPPPAPKMAAKIKPTPPPAPKAAKPVQITQKKIPKPTITHQARKPQHRNTVPKAIPKIVKAIPRSKPALSQAPPRLKSLDFLGSISKMPQPKGMPAVLSAELQADNSRYQNMIQGTDRKAITQSSNLSKWVNVASADTGPVDTRSSRGINSNAAAASGAGSHVKGLNQVQGRVSLASLRMDGGDGTIGSSLGESQGLQVSGAGNIPDSAIMKVLSRYLEKFQYCYEKSLLKNPGLSGNLMMQWTITQRGQTASPKVIRSQLNDSAVHSCMQNELARIPFPKPNGGPVTVRYPFTFSSSML